VIVVFFGPTVSREEAQQVLDAAYRPPVSQGDVFRAASQDPPPEAIGIVDGHFDHVPAVWHKEILWAMSQGIPVYGSASMGALRAAELHAFGMVGVGEIFEAFRDGVLEDDDEVAVVHGPAVTGYRAMSESMVNIRATLRAAEQARVITRDSRNRLEAIAKAEFFAGRSYPALVNAAGCEIDGTDLAAFAGWWPSGRVDQKRADALAMLRLMGDRAAGKTPGVFFSFQHTVFWQHLIDEAGSTLPSGEPLLTQAVLDELWLEPETCVEMFERATRANVGAAGGDQTGGPRRRVVDEMRRSGEYGRLASRAAEKQTALAAVGLDDRGEADEAGEADALLAWYLSRGAAEPGADDAFLQLARAHWDEFLRALVREQHYVRSSNR
jgi:hypothetical protein